jgi:hypothetical protein
MVIGHKHVDYTFYLFHGICILGKKNTRFYTSTPSYYDLFKLAPFFLPAFWQSWAMDLTAKSSCVLVSAKIQPSLHSPCLAELISTAYQP